MERNCFNCKNYNVCFVRNTLSDLLYESHFRFNIDGDELPGKIMDAFTAIANCCFHFEEQNPPEKAQNPNKHEKLV